VELRIERENAGSNDAVTLVNELEAFLQQLYPNMGPCGLSTEQLIKEDVVFFVARTNDMLVGCGGLKFEQDGFAEVKRLYTRPEFRGKGFGKALLQYLEMIAQREGVLIIRLETGTRQLDARFLYERAGYRKITSFGRYYDNDLSLFFEKKLPPISIHSNNQ
jgi:putative acetyltransferase